MHALLILIAFAVDGDTVDVCTQQREVCERVRLESIDAPELHSPHCDEERRLARWSTAYAQKLLDLADVIRIQNRNGRSHGRTIADILIDGRDFGDAMMAAGHAVPFVRGQPHDWC